MDKAERRVSQTATEQFIRMHIRRMLLEAGDDEPKKKEEKPKKKAEKPKKEKKKSRRARGEFIIKSSVPGAPPKGMRLADPAKIMKNLKAKGSASSMKELQSLLNAAISGTDEMSDAFGKAKFVEDAHGREGVSVSMGSIDANNGARFMKITLSAAKTTGALTMDEDMRVEVGGEGVIIYKTKGGKSSWNRAPDKKKKKKSE